ncbi:hypothetical protein Btru_042231 [Bulinus truncatus]|nr:hypothetical protein Btru_042231 [Bulinus truncatus]
MNAIMEMREVEILEMGASTGACHLIIPVSVTVLTVLRLTDVCGSYRRAVTCITHLRTTCHKARHIDIDAASVNFDDSRPVLQELCSDDSLIENYAMHQTCLTRAGPASEQCFVTHLSHLIHGNQSFRFLTKISNHKKKEQVCLDMYNTINCVKRNIETTCGHHSARLAITLVKPMVSINTECNYTVIEAQQKTTKKPHHSHNAYISDKHTGSSSNGKGHREAENTASSICNNGLYVITSAALLFIGTFFRQRPL